MFNLCYECDGNLKTESGTVYGYWGDLKIEFVNLPRHKCDNCGEFYLDESIAILTQEITRAFNEIDNKIKIVDLTDSYKEMVKHLDDIYELIVKGRIKLIYVNDKIIINNKDVISLFNNYDILLAARNIDDTTEDVKREIERIRGEFN